MNNYFKKIKSRKGFGILEMVVALGILMMGVIGFSTLTIATIVTSRTSELRITAANLAREGVEVARNIRDSNWLKIDDSQVINWNDGLAGDYTAVPKFNPASGAWTLDFRVNDIDNAKIYYDNINFLYLQGLDDLTNTKETPFNRLITLNPICWNGSSEYSNGNPCPGSDSQIGIDVISLVKWGEAGRAHEIKQEEKLYNWRIGI